jgi:hypothetical protein
MGELLEDSYTVPEEGEEGFKIFTQKNALLHSALTMSTADSSATLKVEKLRLTADGPAPSMFTIVATSEGTETSFAQKI